MLAVLGLLLVYGAAFLHGRKYQEKQCYLGSLEQRAAMSSLFGPTGPFSRGDTHGTTGYFDPTANDDRGGYV